MKHIFKTAIAAGALAMGLSATAASAVTTDTATIEFDRANLMNKIYIEDGFTFTSSSNGGITLSNDCGSTCLQLSNNETVTVTYEGGRFSLNAFAFRAPGNDDGIDVTGGSDMETFSEQLKGNRLAQASTPSLFNDVTSIIFTNSGNGSSRIDNLGLTVAAVPLPAGGLLLVGALGALALKRRRKAA